MSQRYMRVPEWQFTKRDTPKILFQRVLHLTRENGHYDEAEKIMEYALPEDYDKRELTNYMFDFRAVVNKGGNEGIYIDCYLEGEFDGSGKKHCKIGTFKTLKEGVTGFKIMGALAGALVFYAHQYVDSQIERYTPQAELEQMAKRREEMCQTEML